MIKKKIGTKKNRTKKGGNNDFIYIDPRLSTQPNTDTSYTEIGIIHVCDSIAINIIRQQITNILNTFGNSGFDSILFDQARNKCLQRLAGLIKENNKISNIRFEFISVDPSLITINAYGTLLQKNVLAK